VQSGVILRSARLEELRWINERYAEVGFVPSTLEHEIVIVAEIDGERAGIGRLVDIDEHACELGGMLVFERFRGRGVSRAIIDALLARANGRDVFCIPFAELEALYAGAGFARTDDAPPKVLEKFAWCQRTYDKPVLLMFRSAVAKPPLSDPDGRAAALPPHSETHQR